MSCQREPEKNQKHCKLRLHGFCGGV